MRPVAIEVKHKETGCVICNITEWTAEVLHGIDLSEADLHGVDFSGIDFHGRPLADLYSDNPKPTRPRFCRANLAHANLSNSYLCYADFNGADLSQANLEGADFFEAILVGTDLRGADFKNAKLQAAFLTGAKYDAATKWPTDFLKKGQKLEHFGLVLVQDEAKSKEAQERAAAHRRYVEKERQSHGMCPLCGRKVSFLEGLVNGKRQHRECKEFVE